MKLYYSPGACSLADHIALEEAGLAYEAVKVDLGAKTVEGGGDFTAINPKGYVPALALDDDTVLNENIAILSYIAERADDFMPLDGVRRFRVLEMLAFTSTELHKSFKPFFEPNADDRDKDAAREMLAKRFAIAADALDGRDFVVGEALTVADFYLFVMCMWATGKVGMELPGALPAYYDRLKARPAFAKAMADEGLG